MSQVADRYAEAFFSLAKEEGKVASLKSEAVALRSACDRDLVRLLDLRSVSKEEKKDLFRESLPGADAYLLNLLCLVIDAGRGRALPQILDAFISLCNEELGVQEVTVWSARPLTESERDKIAQVVSERYGKEAEITNRIDESLLAGTRIFIDGRVYDTSLKTRVKSLKDELLRESW